MDKKADKTDKAERKGFMDLISGQKWIKTVEEAVEKNLKSARNSLDKTAELAIKRLNMPSERDYNALLKKVEALEKRIEKLEGVKRVRTPRSKKATDTKSQDKSGSENES